MGQLRTWDEVTQERFMNCPPGMDSDFARFFFCLIFSTVKLQILAVNFCFSRWIFFSLWMIFGFWAIYDYSIDMYRIDFTVSRTACTHLGESIEGVPDSVHVL